MSFRVIVAENSHFMDEDEQWSAGSFGTFEEAVTKAKQIVDTSIDEAFKAGGTESEIYEHYARWGRDPFIVAVDEPQEGATFSARDYAKERCSAMANKT